jgi:hypothetical protein
MPVLHGGKQVYIQGQPLVENKRSEAVLIRLLEARFLEEFRRRIEQVNIQDIDIDTLSIEMLDKIVDHMIRWHVGDDTVAIAETRRQLEASVDQEFPVTMEPEFCGTALVYPTAVGER